MERYWKSHEVLESIWKDSKGQTKNLLNGLILVDAAYVHFQKGENTIFFSILNRSLEKFKDYSRIFLRHKYGIFAKGHQQNDTYQKCIYYQDVSEIILIKRWGRDSNPYIFAICIFESAGERMAALPPHQLFVLSLIENLYFFGNGSLSFLDYS